MYAQVEKPKENKSRAVAQRKNNGKPSFGFVDNIPETIVQRNLQAMANNSPQAKQTAQFLAMAENHSVQELQTIQKKKNNTGLPDNLKSGIENLSGYSMDDVKLHYDSGRPAQLQAHAYAQGTDIHIASGQERYLPHEALHIIQQKQGRVKSMMQMNGDESLNDDKGLGKEADIMEAKALQMNKPKIQIIKSSNKNFTVQRTVDSDLSESQQYLLSTKNYEYYALGKVNNYAQNIKYTEENIDRELASRMSNGLKVWSQNYYNKSQAYLFEGQKANDFTVPNGRFAILGHDTVLNPDIEIHERQVQHDGSVNWSGGIAHELKASTSANYEAVDKLVRAGIKQLKKRQDSGNQYGELFRKLLLTVHNDDPKNAYPFTDCMISTNYSNSPNNVPSTDWSPRLQELLASAVASEGITDPLEIRMEFNGQRYATAIFNT